MPRAADDGAVTEPTQRRPAKTFLPVRPIRTAGRARIQGMTTSERPTTTAGTPTQRRAARPGGRVSPSPALVGVVAMGLAIGIAELLAAFGEWIGIFNTPASPLNSLGQTFIQFTPEWLKEFAIRTFGENDKTALTAGMGDHPVRGRHRHRHRRTAAIPGWPSRSPSLLILVTAARGAQPRPAPRVFDIVPILLGGAGRGLLPGHGLPPAGGPGERAPHAPAASRGPVDDRWHRRRRIDCRRTRRPRRPAPRTRWAAPTAAGARVDRRQFFKIAGIGALVAVGAGALAKWIPSAARRRRQPRRASRCPPRPTCRRSRRRPLNVDGITPFVTNNADFYRVDTAFVVPRVTTDDWQLQIHGAVDNEITLTLRRPDRDAVDRADDHPDLRVQRGRRRPGRQRPLAGRPDRRRAEAGRRRRPAPTACCPPASTASP